jgi:hypothetical protein
VKKLTFERAVLIVFVMIILISTSDMTGKYIKSKLGNHNKLPIVSESAPNLGFPTMLNKADSLFKEGNYKAAAAEYLAMTLNNTLSLDQKVYAYFRLGISHYKLNNYDLAAESFIKATSFNPNDSLAYNNAAVSAFRAKDMKKAMEMQHKALDILPAVEYYYNLARMYEDNGEYELAVDNFLFVNIGEKNLTRVEKIDPVRVKEKIARLSSKSSSSVSETANNILRVYRLDDSREVLTVHENEMRLKDGDFVVQVENHKNTKSIIAEYDRVKYDPYNLISKLVWTIYKDGKSVYSKTSDGIKFPAAAAGNYEVVLNIKYNGNNERNSKKTITIYSNNSTVGKSTADNTPSKAPPTPITTTYRNALYEQLFESDFAISPSGYTDEYNVIWGKDNVFTDLDTSSRFDRSSSLTLKNSSEIDKGLWVNLDNLLKDKNLKGKSINIKFFTRRITNNAKINLVIRVKSKDNISIIQDIFYLDSNWEQKIKQVFIPENATGLTISIKTAPNEQFNIDGFTILK